MPDVTPKGLPFPLATDPLADGAAAIQALAEAVDPRLVGGELNYAERWGDLALQLGVYVDAGLTINFTAVAGVAYWVENYWHGAVGIGGNGYYGKLMLDGADHGWLFDFNTVGNYGPILARRRLSGLAAGVHSVGVQAQTAGGSGGILYAGNGLGTNRAPAYLRVLDGSASPSTRPAPDIDEPEAAPKG